MFNVFLIRRQKWLDSDLSFAVLILLSCVNIGAGVSCQLKFFQGFEPNFVCQLKRILLWPYTSALRKR